MHVLQAHLPCDAENYSYQPHDGWLQTRFGVRTSAMAAMHEARVAGNGHSEWGLMQPARVKGQGFIVQELPLPLVSSPSAGAPMPLVVGLCCRFQTPARALQVLWQSA